MSKASQLTAAGRVAFACLWLFVWSIPVEKTIEIPGVGYLSAALGAAALGAGLLALLIDGRMRTLTRTHLVFALFVAWSALTLRWSLDPDATGQKAITFVSLLGSAWLIWEFCATERNVVQLMQAYVFGTLYATGNAVAQYSLSHQTYYQRYAAAGFDPNDFALTLALSIPMSYGLAIRASGWKASFYWAQIGLVAVSVLLSASRTGFLAACVAAAIVPLTLAYTRRRQKVAVLTVAAVAVFGLVAVIPASSWHRLATVGSEVQSGSLNNRGMIWQAGLEVFTAHWVAGVGSGAYPRGVEPLLGWPRDWLIVAHNTFLSVLVETGVVGFLLFAAFLVLLVKSVMRMEGVSRMVWSVTLAVWFIGVNTLTWETRKPTWFLFALILTQARFAPLKRPLLHLSSAMPSWAELEARA